MKQPADFSASSSSSFNRIITSNRTHSYSQWQWQHKITDIISILYSFRVQFDNQTVPYTVKY